jgi:hypothetical protein
MSVASPASPQGTTFVNPLKDGPVILVSAVGEAEGSRGAAAALACTGADVDAAALLVEVGGRAPRPTLIASVAAHELEQRLGAHLPQARVAARGQVCQLAVPGDAEGLEAASAAATVAREATTVVHVPADLFQSAISEESRLRPTGVLLRADLHSDRSLVALTVRDLIERGVPSAVLKRRLSWVAERRALFGILPPGSQGGLPERLVRLCGAAR